MSQTNQTELDDRDAIAWATYSTPPQSQPDRSSDFSDEMSDAIAATLRMLEAQAA